MNTSYMFVTTLAPLQQPKTDTSSRSREATCLSLWCLATVFWFLRPVSWKDDKISCLLCLFVTRMTAYSLQLRIASRQKGKRSMHTKFAMRMYPRMQRVLFLNVSFLTPLPSDLSQVAHSVGWARLTLEWASTRSQQQVSSSRNLVTFQRWNVPAHGHSSRCQAPGTW